MQLNLADCVVIKRENLFLLTLRDGRLPAAEPHPLGLWYRDCRFLRAHELLLDGAPLLLLQASDAQGTRALHALTDGERSLSIRVERTLVEPVRLRERIVLHSHRQEQVALRLDLRLGADFAPMLAVRGLVPAVERAPETSRHERGVRIALRGRDDVLRATTVQASTEPLIEMGASDVVLGFELELPAGGEHELELDYSVGESGPGAAPPSRRHTSPERTAVRSDDELFERVLGRSLADLELLRSELDGLSYFAAGVPWYATLFGRDSLIAAWQTLAFVPEVAADTLRLLGRRLGSELDDTRDEEPGKVLHELRVGEPAALGETPFARYHGSADATPLWLCLLGEHAAWSGSLDLFRELRPQVDAALEWLERHGDLDGDGLIEYRRRAPHGLANQGWKDSPGGVPDGTGRPLEPPIALVEVQGYAVRALRELARLFELDGDAARAELLRARGGRLEAALERFWLPDADAYAIGLDGAKRPGSGLTSNQGHLLWAGAVTGERARSVRDLLMGPRMFSGWGIRTLGEGHAGYNPLSYHGGSVWPHDTALIAAGLRDYGFDDDFAGVFDALLEAASLFGGHRLPELFGGYTRSAHEAPVPYPVACAPQAWAAGAVPYLLATGLGIRPDALARLLRVERPWLPAWVGRLEVEGLRVGAARVDLRFERAGTQVVLADARIDGDLELVLETGTG